METLFGCLFLIGMIVACVDFVQNNYIIILVCVAVISVIVYLFIYFKDNKQRKEYETHIGRSIDNEEWVEIKRHNYHLRQSIYNNEMSGVEYERYCAEKLLLSGVFSKIEFTATTNDFGADIIGYTPNGAIIVVQCKRYSGRVGNSAVQEVVGAIRHYNADGAMLITNSTLTSNASTLARENDVIVLENYR